MGQRESRDAARSLSVVHYMDRDVQAAAELAVGLAERSGASEGKPSLLAVLPTPDDVLSVSEAVLAVQPESTTLPPLIPLTAASRAKRIIASGASSIAADARTAARLLSESRLDLAQLHTLVLVWPEEILRDDENRGFLESVLAEVPRSVERVAVSAERTPELVQFLERSMWRAREIDHRAAVSERSGVPLRVAAVPVSERTRAIRTVLDGFDPDTTALITFSDAAEAAARHTAALSGPSVLAVRGVPDRRFNLGILFDDVPSAEVLTEVASMVDELIAVLRPSRLAALQKVAMNVTPMAWTGALANARLTLDALRDEIRGYVASGGHTSWVPAVEPLFEGLDPVEVAAAALALLDRERRKAKRAAQLPAAAPAPDRSVREERPAIQSRQARRDDDRGRPGGDRGFVKKRPWAGEARGASERSRGPRREIGDRPRSARDQRDERPARGRGDDRPPRDSRGADRGRGRDEIERIPRAAHEGREWSERGERLRNSRRGPRGRDAE